MMRLPALADVWRAGPLCARVLRLTDGAPPGHLSFPEPKDPTVRWVLARLELHGVTVGYEALPVSRFVMRYELADGGADPVN